MWGKNLQGEVDVSEKEIKEGGDESNQNEII